MPFPLRVLILEDNIADVELILHELKRAGFEPTWTRVETEPDFLRELQNSPDVILSDFSMPQFDFLRAQELLKEFDPEIPIILISGTVGEDVAVEAMKLGATDYLLKDRLSRLGASVQNALNQKKLRDEKKQADLDLRHNEARFRSLIEHGLDSISLLGADGTLIWESPSSTHLLGYKFNEYLGKSLFDLIHPDDLPRIIQQFQELINESGAVRHQSFRLRHASGKWVWVESIGTNLLDQPSVNAIVINYRDITERKQAEDALRNREEQYRSLFEDSPISLWIEDFSEVKKQLEQLKQQGISDLTNYIQTHPDFILECAGLVKILDVNQAALKLYKASDKSQLLGSLTKNFRNTLPEQFEYELIQIANNKLSFEREGIDQTITGEEIYISLHWSVVPGYESNLERVIVSTIDITERKLAAEQLYKLNLDLERRVAERTAELNKTNLELEHANRAKDEFLANMSHELRTPLNSILGLSESMLEQYNDTLNENQQKSLQVIESSGRHLLDLINDILDLSKIEAGKFDYYPQIINVNDLCKSSQIFVKTQAMKKGITLSYEIEDTISDFSADPRRLKQILVNLLTNAVKFTPNGGKVTLKVSVTPGVIQFSVIDTGIGITPENLRRLFTPFVQVESSLNRHFEGTGLGLTLVHKLTDLHGGSVEVESEVGKGSRFTIKLPYQPGVLGQANIMQQVIPPLAELQTDFQPKAEKKNTKILLVEDNQANILTIGEYLENHGYEIIIANDGVQAIEKAEQTLPNIILMDIQMPIMDGLEATRRLRADVRFASVPIIALTALAMPGDRERCLEAGANEYMSKPVSLKELRTVIENFLK